jgi:hypothetical protein
VVQRSQALCLSLAAHQHPIIIVKALPPSSSSIIVVDNIIADVVLDVIVATSIIDLVTVVVDIVSVIILAALFPFLLLSLLSSMMMSTSLWCVIASYLLCSLAAKPKSFLPPLGPITVNGIVNVVIRQRHHLADC